jgi:hypothetical protein
MSAPAFSRDRVVVLSQLDEATRERFIEFLVEQDVKVWNAWFAWVGGGRHARVVRSPATGTQFFRDAADGAYVANVRMYEPEALAALKLSGKSPTKSSGDEAAGGLLTSSPASGGESRTPARGAGAGAGAGDVVIFDASAFGKFWCV